jgi:HSP20 family protein
MSVILRNKSFLPSLASDFFESGSLFPRVYDFEGDLFDFSSKVMIPEVNIFETDKEFKLEMAAPGLEKKDFKIEFENDMLTISAEKEEEVKEDKKNFKRREFSYNSFNRSFMMPENSLPEKIDAKYDKGILFVTIPKKEVVVSKPKKEIKVS